MIGKNIIELVIRFRRKIQAKFFLGILQMNIVVDKNV